MTNRSGTGGTILLRTAAVLWFVWGLVQGPDGLMLVPTARGKLFTTRKT